MGQSELDAYRQVTTSTNLEGCKPGDLPVEHPTKVELVINLKTAKAVGLTIPPSLVARRRGDRIGA